MPEGHHPEDPTRRLPPVVHEREVVRPVAEEPWVEILDRLGSLRAGLAMVAVVAVAALGVALWALLAGEGDDREGASPVRVERLEDRLDAVEADVERAASQSGLAGIRDNQQALQGRVRALEQAVGNAQATREAVDGLSENVETLQQGIEQLDQRIDALDQQP